MKLAGWTIFAVTMGLVLLDGWGKLEAIRAHQPHGVLSAHHIGLLALGIFGISLTSEKVVTNIERWIRAYREGKSAKED